MDHSSTISQWIGNVVSVGAIVGAFMGWAPAIAALVAATWYVIQIYESETVQKWKTARLRRRLERLHQQAVDLEMQLVDVADPATLEHLKKMIAMRVDVDAGLREREINHEHANELMVVAAKERKSAREHPEVQTHD